MPDRYTNQPLEQNEDTILIRPTPLLHLVQTTPDLTEPYLVEDIWSVMFSADSTLLLTAGGGMYNTYANVQLWEVQSGRMVFAIGDTAGSSSYMAHLHPTTHDILAAHDHTVSVWHWADVTELSARTPSRWVEMQALPPLFQMATILQVQASMAMCSCGRLHYRGNRLKRNATMLYLFYGPDELACSEALAELRRQLPPDVAALNTATLDGRKLKLNELARASEAMPFLAERRLVIVQDALQSVKAGKEREELRDYLKRVPPTCDLVFVERGDVDKRNILFTYLKQAGELREFQSLDGDSLLRWLSERARLLDVRIDQKTGQHLVEYVGNDSRALLTELAKLAAYVGHKGKITSDVVDLLVQDSQEHNLFAFIDDLSLRKADTALRGVRQLLADGQAAIYILFMLMRQVRILLGVQELAAQRMREQEMAAQLGQKPFVVRKALQQVRNFKREELERLHDRLLATDQAIKTGRLQSEVALELLVLEVCGVAKH